VSTGTSAATLPAEREVRVERQVIGGDERGARPMQGCPFQLERGVVVDVVQVQEGQQARIAPRAAQVDADVGALEMPGEEPPREPAQPFVEVAAAGALEQVRLRGVLTTSEGCRAYSPP
jgi:hypothetical protein